MKAVVAQFRVDELNQRAKYHGQPGEQESHTVVLNAASGPGNEQWAKATPYGKVEMTINNPEALQAFVLGASYRVTFERVE